MPNERKYGPEMNQTETESMAYRTDDSRQTPNGRKASEAKEQMFVLPFCDCVAMTLSRCQGGLDRGEKTTSCLCECS
ncbi:Dynein heavy chain family protein [Anopheles sinensis]|uniref:Dynein heavy chain family protein n=1 Tax=Anopheles sinensis TaxID=74873 RepID=A0A084WIR6_ANOSI|nr:Dynein heavy chain family protein [Anopheles sinensis]